MSKEQILAGIEALYKEYFAPPTYAPLGDLEDGRVETKPLTGGKKEVLDAKVKQLLESLSLPELGNDKERLAREVKHQARVLTHAIGQAAAIGLETQVDILSGGGVITQGRRIKIPAVEARVYEEIE